MRLFPKINILLTTLTGIFVLIVALSCVPEPSIQSIHESGQLKIGMSMSEVENLILEDQELVSSWSKSDTCTRKKITEEAKWELWDFASPGCGTNPDNHHALVFKNGKLVEIREVYGMYSNPPNYDDLQLP